MAQVLLVADDLQIGPAISTSAIRSAPARLRSHSGDQRERHRERRGTADELRRQRPSGGRSWPRCSEPSSSCCSPTSRDCSTGIRPSPARQRLTTGRAHRRGRRGPGPRPSRRALEGGHGQQDAAAADRHRSGRALRDRLRAGSTTCLRASAAVSRRARCFAVARVPMPAWKRWLGWSAEVRGTLTVDAGRHEAVRW